jgi:hypothetical protein
MSRRFVDLHTHSTASDGGLAPAAVIDLADRLELAAVALCDHDTTAGLDEAADRASQYPLLHFVPGIEISAVFSSGTLHILGLGLDPAAPALRVLTEQLRLAREQRNPKILHKLQAMGIGLTMDDVLGQVKGTHRADRRIVSRMHFAQALVAGGWAASLREAFKVYVGNEGKAFVDKERIPPREAIGAIRESGGVAVLAHPVQLRYDNHAQLERMIRELVEAGLGGMEVYHSDHTAEQTRLYMTLAERFGLVLAGGSDFHGRGKPDVEMGRPRVPIGMVDWLKSIS